MIYISFADCINDRASQHTTANSLLLSLLSSLGYEVSEIRHNENGRPYVDIENADISISHSGTAVIVGVLTSRVADVDGCVAFPFDGDKLGIDLEEIKENADLSQKNRLLKRFLGKEATSVEEFYRSWTRNESYGKMTGEGVFNDKSFPCNTHSFTVDLNGKKYSLSISIQKESGC